MYMRINEITPILRTPKFDNHLDSMPNFLVNIHPELFLFLTTYDEKKYPGHRDTFSRRAMALQDYNKWIKKYGRFVDLPYLKIAWADNDSARVYGHEGRHRAAALADRGGQIRDSYCNKSQIKLLREK